MIFCTSSTIIEIGNNGKLLRESHAYCAAIDIIFSPQSNADSGPSLRLVPGPATSNSISIQSTSHPVHAGVHDSMRHGQRNLATEVSSSSMQHPLQHRLENWDATRDNLKLTMQRNMFGMAAPIRTLMERRIVEHVSESLGDYSFR